MRTDVTTRVVPASCLSATRDPTCASHQCGHFQATLTRRAPHAWNKTSCLICLLRCHSFLSAQDTKMKNTFPFENPWGFHSWMQFICIYEYLYSQRFGCFPLKKKALWLRLLPPFHCSSRWAETCSTHATCIIILGKSQLFVMLLAIGFLLQMHKQFHLFFGFMRESHSGTKRTFFFLSQRRTKGAHLFRRSGGVNRLNNLWLLVLWHFRLPSLSFVRNPFQLGQK